MTQTDQWYLKIERIYITVDVQVRNYSYLLSLDGIHLCILQEADKRGALIPQRTNDKVLNPKTLKR